MKLIKEIITEQRTVNVTYLTIDDNDDNTLVTRKIKEEPLEIIESDLVERKEYNQDNVNIEKEYSIKEMYLEAMVDNPNEMTIIMWPESQEYMEEEWFKEEAQLINDDFGLKYFGSSAYIIPLTRIYF